MRKSLVLSLLFLTACGGSPPVQPPPASPSPRAGECSVTLQSAPVSGQVKGIATYGYQADDGLKDLHQVTCYVTKERLGSKVVTFTWEAYMRSDDILNSGQGSFELVDGVGENLFVLNALGVVDYDTSKIEGYTFKTTPLRKRITLNLDSDSFGGTFSLNGEFRDEDLSNQVFTVTATFGGSR